MLKLFIDGNGEDYFPVYYSSIKNGKDEVVMLSPSCKAREMYRTQLKDMFGVYAPCDNIDNLCEACALFGTVIDGQGKASRLRFTDLKVQIPRNLWYDEIVTLKPLSTPKITSTEFYLKKPTEQATFWTFDYYVEYRDGKLNVVLKDGEAQGRKFYWHALNMSEGNWAASEKTNQNMTIRPLRKGVVFTGRLYFEDITEDELQKLLYMLSAMECKERNLDKKKHGYKLGAAKPLGFGSIACNVD